MSEALFRVSRGDRFIQSLAAITIADGVVAHSIIAVEGDGLPEKGDDGVVKYTSAHVDGVASEKIVLSGDSTQGHPETIQEIKRILFERPREQTVLQNASPLGMNP